MPVVITDIQVAFAAGALFADAGARVIETAKRESEAAFAKLYSSYMLRSLVYVGVFLGPAATIFMLAYPAWETQYVSGVFDKTVDYDGTSSLNLNAYPYGIFLMGLFLGAWFGNWLGFRWILAGARKRLRILYVAIMLVSFAIFGLRYPAPAQVCDYQHFTADPFALPCRSVFAHKSFLFNFLVLLLLSALPVVIGFFQIRMSVKRLSKSVVH
jgi:hypothetical protein